MSKIKVVVTGASGRMGKEVIKKVLSDKKLKLIGAIENHNHPTIGKDVGSIINKKKLGLKIKAVSYTHLTLPTISRVLI